MKHHKILLFAAALIFTRPVFAQDDMQMPVDNETKKVTFETVVETPGISASKLYENAIQWVTINYLSGKNQNLAGKYDEILFDDPENGKLIFKGGLRLEYKDSGAFSTCSKKLDLVYTFHLYFKDGKYRYVITDFVLQKFHKASTNSFSYGGVGVTDYKDAKVDEDPLENFYPLAKAPECKKAYTVLMKSIYDEIASKLASLKPAMMTNDEDW